MDLDGQNTAKPAPESIAGRPLSPKAPESKGQVERSPQTGSTDAATDGGGGMGNSTTELHDRIFGKK